MSKTEHPRRCSVLRNYTADEGRPLEPACRSRTQTTFRCCSLRGVVVSGEGKGPGEKPGSGDFSLGLEQDFSKVELALEAGEVDANAWTDRRQRLGLRCQ